MHCTTPFHKEVDGANYNFPCGKCHDCLTRRISHWSVRLVKEGERQLSSFFLTLTYNTDHVPISKNGFMTLDKTDVQKFLKRLRKRSKTKIKYFAVGEYGGLRNRPHYHLIIFGATSLDIEKSWTLGSTFFGTVADASIGYTLKYMCKKGKIPLHPRDDRQPEFQLFSQKLGDNYLTPQMIQWHKDDVENRNYTPLKGNIKAPMPKYYKKKIYDDFERDRLQIHIRNQILEKNNDINHIELSEQERISLYTQKAKNFRRLTSKL